MLPEDQACKADRTKHFSQEPDHCQQPTTFGPSGNFTVHPFNYTKLPYNPADLIPVVRASNTLLAAAVKADAPYSNVKQFAEAVRANPGQFNYGAVQGITEFTFWGFVHHEKR